MWMMPVWWTRWSTGRTSRTATRSSATAIILGMFRIWFHSSSSWIDPEVIKRHNLPETEEEFIIQSSNSKSKSSGMVFSRCFHLFNRTLRKKLIRLCIQIQIVIFTDSANQVSLSLRLLASPRRRWSMDRKMDFRRNWSFHVYRSAIRLWRSMGPLQHLHSSSSRLSGMLLSISTVLISLRFVSDSISLVRELLSSIHSPQGSCCGP